MDTSDQVKDEPPREVEVGGRRRVERRSMLEAELGVSSSGVGKVFVWWGGEGV